MAMSDVPTGRFAAFTDIDRALNYVNEIGAPIVVKADGLAAGKGVTVAMNVGAAVEAVHECLEGRFGEAGMTCLVEEYLDGPEVSLFAITDGTTVVPLQPAQDFKRVGDGDTGPNTGGMGAYTPLPWAPRDLVDEVTERVLQPTVDEMARRGTPFSGLLYAGLAITKRGVRVIEFNARFGDPETQPLMALLDSPLGVVLRAAARGTLDEVAAPRWKPGAAVAVVVASKDYPAAPRTGDVIHGLMDAERVEGVEVIHAGTARGEGGALVTSGGRVLAVTAVGSDVADARAKAYEAVGKIRIDGSHHRSDIAAGI
jgi:phosphoribosylamine--glycine ligase